MAMHRRKSDNERLPIVGSTQVPVLGVSGKAQLIAGGSSFLRSNSLTSGLGVDPRDAHPQQLSSLSSSASAATLSHALNGSVDKLDSSNSSGESSGMSGHTMGPKSNPFSKTFPLETLPSSSKQHLSSLQHSVAPVTSRGKGAVAQEEDGTVTPTLKTRRKSSQGAAAAAESSMGVSGLKIGDPASGPGSSEKKVVRRGSKKSDAVPIAVCGSSASTLTSVDDAQIVLTPLKQKQQMTTDNIAAQFSSSLPTPSVMASATLNGATFFSSSGGASSCSTTPPPPHVSSNSVTPIMNKHKTLVATSAATASSNTRKLSPVMSSLAVDGGDGALLESATEKKAKKVVKRKTSHGSIVLNSGSGGTSSSSSQVKRNTETIAPISHSTATGGTGTSSVVITPIDVRRRKKQSLTIDAGTNVGSHGGSGLDDVSGRSRTNSFGTNSGYSSANDSAGVDVANANDGSQAGPAGAAPVGHGNGALLAPVISSANIGHNREAEEALTALATMGADVDCNKKHRLQHNDMLIRDKLQQGLAMNQKQSGRGSSSTVGIAVSSGGGSVSGGAPGGANPFAAAGSSVTKNPFAATSANSAGASNPPARGVNTGANPGATMHKFSLWNKKAKVPAAASTSTLPASDGVSLPSSNPFASSSTSSPFTSVAPSVLGPGSAPLSTLSTPLASIAASPTSGGGGGSFFGSSRGKMAARLRGITAEHDAVPAAIVGGDQSAVADMPPLVHSSEPVASGSLANSLRQMIDSAGPTSVSSSTDVLRRSEDIPEDGVCSFAHGDDRTGAEEVAEDMEGLVMEMVDRSASLSAGVAADEEPASRGGEPGSGDVQAVPTASNGRSGLPFPMSRAASNISTRSNTSNRSQLTVEEEEELKNHHVKMLGRLGGEGSESSGDEGEGELSLGSDDGDDDDGDQLLANRMSSSRTVSPALSEISQSIDDPLLYPRSPSPAHLSPVATLDGADHPAIAVTKANMGKTLINHDKSYSSTDDDGVDDAEIVVPFSQIKSSPKANSNVDKDVASNSFRSIGSTGSAGSSYKSTGNRRTGSAGSMKASAATMLATLGQPSIPQNAATIRTNINSFGRPGSGNAEVSNGATGGAGAHGVPGGGTGTGSGTGSGTLQLKWKKGRQIGEGSFGRVYQGMNTATGESLAIKQLVLVDGSGEEVKRLQQEIDVMEDLKHPNIVRYIGTSISPQYLFILLEYVTGGSIAKILKQFGPIDEELLRKFTYHITCGVEYLHLKGIIHRDIKGANVLVTDGGIAKLSDFGCSKRLVGMCTASLEESLKVIKGSVPWMAPEVIKQSGFGRSSDIWSVGATMIEMATARLPWPNFTNDLAAMFHVATSKEPPPIPKSLSPLCSDFIRSAMQIDPKLRPTATDLLHMLPFLGPLRPPADAAGSSSTSTA